MRIGINAPKNVPVHREEIYERIKRELSGGEVNGNVQDAPAAPAQKAELSPYPPGSQMQHVENPKGLIGAGGGSQTSLDAHSTLATRMRGAQCPKSPDTSGYVLKARRA